MKSIATLPTCSGARVLIRVDYNVPFKGTKIVDARRIEASFSTIDAVLKKGGMPILLAHLGKATESLRLIATFLSKRYNIVFVDHDVYDDRINDILAQVPKGTVVLLQNIRRYEGEERNDISFTKALARLGTYYINDAFSVSHRAHVSVVGLPKLLPSFAGFQLLAEIKALAPVLESPKHPFLFVLGGAKFSTKIPLLKRFIKTADQVVITGAVLNNFYQVSGFEVGESVVESGYDKEIKTLLKSERLLLPVDVVVTQGGKKATCTPYEVQSNDVIVDIGPQSIALIAAKIHKAKLVVWNGPTGWYEKGFTKGTVALAKAIAVGNARAIIGGGDTGAVVEKSLKESTNKKIFVSTGGGATLEYFAHGTLPGLKALEKSKK